MKRGRKIFGLGGEGMRRGAKNKLFSSFLLFSFPLKKSGIERV